MRTSSRWALKGAREGAGVRTRLRIFGVPGGSRVSIFVFCDVMSRVSFIIGVYWRVGRLSM